MPDKLFDLGPVHITLKAMRALMETQTSLLPMIEHHQSGDWGIMDAHDKKVNDAAIYEGQRIISSYRLLDGKPIWLLTEADRSSTTVLLPSEY